MNMGTQRPLEHLLTLAPDEDAATFDLSGVLRDLGIDLAECKGIAWTRTKLWWLFPVFHPNMSRVQEDRKIQLLLLQTKTEPARSIAIYPCGLVDAETTLAMPAKGKSSSGRSAGNLCAKVARTRASKQQASAAVYLCETDSEAGASEAVKRALGRARQGCASAEGEDDKGGQSDNWSLSNKLGFCTWSSVGEGVRPTKSRVEAVLQSLAAAGLAESIETFLIDDGWQDVTKQPDGDLSSGGLWRFEAWPELECSLAEMVELVKSYLGPKTKVGVWMTLNGYWEGIAPSSDLIDRYSCRRYQKKDGQMGWRLPSPHQALDFWHDWFSVLREQGVSFVKVDNQAAFCQLAGLPGAEIYTTMWEGMNQAADQIFGPGKAIQCMAHSERLVNSPWAFNGRHERPFRNSDDFGMGQNDEGEYHHEHIIQNLYNSVLTRELNLTPDADMWMSAQQLPLPHALLRSLYPGQILLSDKHEQHDLGLVQRLVGRRKAGHIETIRAETAPILLQGRLTDWTFWDDGVGPGLFAASRHDQVSSSTLAVWNTRRSPRLDSVKDALTSRDLCDALGSCHSANGSTSYLLHRDGVSGQSPLATVWRTDDPPKSLILPVCVPPRSCEAYRLAPLHEVRGPSNSNIAVACLGLIDKLNGLAAILGVDVVEGSESVASLDTADSWNRLVSPTSIEVCVAFEGVLRLVVITDESEPEVAATCDGKRVAATVLPLESARLRRKVWSVDVTVGVPCPGSGDPGHPSAWTVSFRID